MQTDFDESVPERYVTSIPSGAAGRV